MFVRRCQLTSVQVPCWDLLQTELQFPFPGLYTYCSSVSWIPLL